MLPPLTLCYLRLRSGTLWYALLCSGTLWYALVHSATLWYALLPLWYALVRSGTLCYALVRSGTLCYLCYALLCSGTLCYALLPLWYALVRSAMLCYPLVRSGTLCYALLHSAMLRPKCDLKRWITFVNLHSNLHLPCRAPRRWRAWPMGPWPNTTIAVPGPAKHMANSQFERALVVAKVIDFM